MQYRWEGAVMSENPFDEARRHMEEAERAFAVQMEEAKRNFSVGMARGRAQLDEAERAMKRTWAGGGDPSGQPAG
jgi:hypothetical protein